MLGFAMVCEFFAGTSPPTPRKHLQTATLHKTSSCRMLHGFLLKRLGFGDVRSPGQQRLDLLSGSVGQDHVGLVGLYTVLGI
jgi:hypothetical protein